MFFNQILKIELSPEEIKQAIIKSKENQFIDNLRDRHPNVAFDCKMRGYIGEIALNNWFNSYGIKIEATNYLMEDINMDIDFSYKNIDIELKTSLVPDIDENLEKGTVVLDTAITPELKAEGAARELMRTIQEMRKVADLVPKDQIVAYMTDTQPEWFEKHQSEILKTVGAEKVIWGAAETKVEKI